MASAVPRRTWRDPLAHSFIVALLALDGHTSVGVGDHHGGDIFGHLLSRAARSIKPRLVEGTRRMRIAAHIHLDAC